MPQRDRVMSTSRATFLADEIRMEFMRAIDFDSGF